MSGKKTGLYLNPIAEEIVNEVAKKYSYTNLSKTINFIILEYSKLVKQESKQEVVEQKVEEKVQTSLSDWFVAEEKQ